MYPSGDMNKTVKGHNLASPRGQNWEMLRCNGIVSNYITCNSNEDWHSQLGSLPEVAKKVWNILKKHIFPELFENELYWIPLQSMFSLLYNATLFVSMPSSRSEILPSWGGGVGKYMGQNGLYTEQNNPHWELSSGMPYRFGWMVVFLPKWIALLPIGTFLALPSPKCKIHVSQLWNWL